MILLNNKYKVQHYIEIMETTPLICDIGSLYVRMGFAGDEFPKETIPSLVGRPSFRSEKSFKNEVQLNKVMIGSQASKYRSLLQLSHPTSKDELYNFEDIELLLRYSFKKIGFRDLRGTSVFLTQPFLNPIFNKMGMMELMFQQFSINRIQHGIQPLMSLFSEGTQTGLLVESGDVFTDVIPVFKGQILKNSTQRFWFAGRHVTNQLINLINKKGYYLNHSQDHETVRQIKEKFCFVSGDIEMDNKMAQQTCAHQKQYKLPDGKKLKIGKQRFLAPQIMFNPKLAGLNADGCGQMVISSINSCDMSLMNTFYANIIISGGNSMIPGFPTRLQNDLKSRFKKALKVDMKNPRPMKIRVLDPPSRKYNKFIGASIIAEETKHFDRAWTYKRQYEQKGKTRIAQELSLNKY